MLDCVILTDNTGSMSTVLSEIKRRSKELCERLYKDLPGIRLSLCAFNNYADSNGERVYHMNGFCGEEKKDDIFSFLNSYKRVGGGYSKGNTGRACSAVYELGMQFANSLDWRDDVAKVVIIVGDEEPSHVSYGVDWRDELTKLVEKEVSVYGVHCLGDKGTKYFYERVSNDSKGVSLTLDQFNNITELLYAVSYKTQGEQPLENFALEMQRKAKLTRSMFNMLNSLSSGTLASKLNVEFKDYSQTAPGELKPVDPCRFQVLDVDEDQDIKSFVQASGATFRVGKGFYEFTKSELIQERKEVVLVEKLSGDMWSGAEARNILGHPYGDRGTLSPRTLDKSITEKYTIFIQSTSNNRKLTGGTKFLYEVDHV